MTPHAVHPIAGALPPRLPASPKGRRSLWKRAHGRPRLPPSPAGVEIECHEREPCPQRLSDQPVDFATPTRDTPHRWSAVRSAVRAPRGPDRVTDERVEDSGARRCQQTWSPCREHDPRPERGARSACPIRKVRAHGTGYGAALVWASAPKGLDSSSGVCAATRVLPKERLRQPSDGRKARAMG